MLALLFTQSLETGTIPHDWSNALISPVFKKGNVHKPSNYRPVSLTTVTCKIMEHIICSHIHGHLKQHSLLTPVQHGFRKQHSCESQLLITLDDFYSSFDKSVQTDVGILDFSRAFDTVPHQRLLGKLSHYGINGNINRWIEAFLSGRTMQVVVDGETSKAAPVTSGVPQGTVLGPLLFLLYINDMPDVLSEGTKLRLFADDSLVYREITCLDDQTILQKDLISLEQWAEKWGMRFNASKCQIMHISRGQAQTRMYSLCNEILSTVKTAKYLGVTVSDDLQWHHQIHSVMNKANSMLHLVARNLRNCPRSTRSLAYTTLIRPKLEYSCSVWDPHTKADIDSLEMVNRRAARMVFNKSWREQGVSPTTLLQNLGWKLLKERRRHQRLTMMYRIDKELVAIPSTRLDKSLRENRGHEYKFVEMGSTCNTVKFSYYVRTIKDWNTLNRETATSATLEQFKASLSQ